MLAATLEQWVEALKLHAEVLALDSDFDLSQVAADFRPEMIIFSALEWSRPWPVRIANNRAHPEIPRVLNFNSDPHDPMRTHTLAMADQHGVEAIFVTSEAYRQHMPELRHRAVHVVNQFVDAADFRDYGLPKSIPVSIFGNILPEFYDWRVRTMAALDGVLPVMMFPHPGYADGPRSPFGVTGPAYARMINRSDFVIADTTRLDYIVRKHLEIPASGAVLVAPASRALTQYGFVDGENCVLGEGPDLVNRIAAVARDRDRYRRICRAGHDLVHARYTRQHWTAYLDWLDCRDSLKAGQMVVQEGPLGRFSTSDADRTSAAVELRPSTGNQAERMLAAVRDAILSGGDLSAAQAQAHEVASWASHMAEPHFMLGILALLRGDAAVAVQALERRAQAVAAIDPACSAFDPVEVAWLLIVAHLRGQATAEAALREHAAVLRHVSLRRALWFVDGAPHGDGLPDAALLERRHDDHLSTHWLGEEDFTLWSDLLARIVVANHLALAEEARSRASQARGGSDGWDTAAQEVAA